VGYYLEGANIDSITVSQNGFFLRDTDLILGAGVNLSLTSGGRFDFKRGTVNATRSVFSDNGNPYTEELVTWLDDSSMNTSTELRTSFVHN